MTKQSIVKTSKPDATVMLETDSLLVILLLILSGNGLGSNAYREKLACKFMRLGLRWSSGKWH